MAGLLDKIKGMLRGKSNPGGAGTGDASKLDALKEKAGEVKDKVDGLVEKAGEKVPDKVKDVYEKVSDKVESIIPGDRGDKPGEPAAADGNPGETPGATPDA